MRRILPRADRSKATVKVRVDFLARDEQAVLPEMGVRVRFLPDNAPPGIESGAIRDKIFVPQAAVLSGSDGNFVWVVNEDLASKQAVQVGANSGERIEISSGVNAGDQGRGPRRGQAERRECYGAGSGVAPA